MSLQRTVQALESVPGSAVIMVMSHELSTGSEPNAFSAAVAQCGQWLCWSLHVVTADSQLPKETSNYVLHLLIETLLALLTLPVLTHTTRRNALFSLCRNKDLSCYLSLLIVVCTCREESRGA